jgi:TP901 family phage tail tape measure protein
MNKLNKSSGTIGQSLNEAATEMQEFGKQAGLAIRRFAAFTAVTGVIYSLTNSINQGIQAFIEYDKELVRLQQVTGQTAGGLKQLQNSISQLATGLGVSSKELTTVSVTLAQAGLSAKDTERALRALALSSLAPSFDDMNETVEGSIALMRQFGISAGQLEQALGSVNAVAAAFAVEADDLITAIQRTGGVFATASKGVSEGTDALNEFISVFTSVRATTRESAETIATGLRTIFTRIQRGSTIDALKEFGVTLTDSEGKFVGAYRAVQLLSEGLSKLDPRDIKFSRIVEELGGFRQIGKVIPLIQQFSVAQNALKIAQTGQSSLAKDAATAQLSLANQIQKVREEFFALFREIGQSKGFQSLLTGVLTLTRGLIKLADVSKSLLPALSVVLAFKGASALTQFASGFSKGFRPGGGKPEKERPRFADGGRVRRFATGGVVPGSGDRDTVPAMLTPGEFVVRKQAVKSIGTAHLHRINKRAKGGPITVEKLKDINPNAVQPDYRNTEEAKNKVGEKDQTWSTYRDQGRRGKVRSTAVKYMQPRDEVYGDVEYVPIPDPNRSEVEKYFGKIVLKKGIKSINPKDKRISTAYENYAQDKVKTIGARYSGDYDPLDFETGDVKFYSSEENIQKYVSINKVLSKRLRHQNKDNRIKWQPNSPEQKELEPTTIYHPTDLTENNNLKKRISDWILLSQNQRTTQAIREGDSFSFGGLVQKFAEGGEAARIRRVGIIDSDVLRDKINAEKVAQGMESIGSDSIQDYTIQLAKLGVQKRKSGDLKKFRVIAGAAGSGKSSLATGVSANDNATLRKTIRSHIITPQDLDSVDEILTITANVSDAKLEGYLRDADRTYTVSSSTKAEQDLIKRNKESRDITGQGLYGREPGKTKGVPADFGVEEATLIDQLGSKNVVLGRKEDAEGNLTNRFRRKREDELPEIVQAEGFYTGGFAPPTRGHRGAFDTLLANVIAKNPKATLKDILVSVAPNVAMVEGKEGLEHAARYGIFDADFRSLLADVNFKGAMISQDAQSTPGILPKVMEVPSENNRRKFARLKGAMAITSGKEQGVLGKYERAGIEVTDIPRIEDISATKVRELLFSQNYTELDKIVNPEVGAILKGNQPQLKNRSVMVPVLLEELHKAAEANTVLANQKADDILANAPGGPYANVSKKLKTEHPDIAAQVKSIREQRDQFKKSISGAKAHSIISELAAAYPEIYGIDPSRRAATAAASISAEDARSHLGDRVKSLVSGRGAATPEPSLLESIKQNVTKQLAIPKGSGTLPTDSKTITSAFLNTKIPSDPTFGMFSGKTIDPGIVKKVWRQTYPGLSEDKTASYIALKEWLEAQYNTRTGAKTEKLSQAIQESKMVGLVGMLPIGHEKLSGPFTWMLGKNAAGEDVSVTASIIERGLGKQYEEEIKKAQSHAEQGSELLASGLASKMKKRPESLRSLDKAQLETLGQGNIEGAYVEQALARLWANLDNVSTRTRPIDYPDGLGESAELFPGISPTMPTEVKRTINSDSRSDAIEEFQRYFRLIHAIPEPKAKKEAVKALASGGEVQRFMAGGVATKTRKPKEVFGTGETAFPSRISKKYAEEQHSASESLRAKLSWDKYPKDERIMVNEDKVQEAYQQPFDRDRFTSSFKEKISRDSLFERMSDFAKFIGLPQEDLSLALPLQLDFGASSRGGGLGMFSAAEFGKGASGIRPYEGYDLSKFGYGEKEKQESYGLEKLIAAKEKEIKKIRKTPTETFDDGSFSFDSEAFQKTYIELDNLKNRFFRLKDLKREAEKAALAEQNTISSATGRGTIGFAPSMGYASTTQNHSLYHEMTHQLFEGLRTRSAESFTKYRDRVSSLFSGDNDDLADAFDSLTAVTAGGGYTSADVVYGRSYKSNNLSQILSSYYRQNLDSSRGTTPIPEDITKNLASLSTQSTAAKRAREYRPINPQVNEALLQGGAKFGMTQEKINRMEDNGKEEFLTTLIEKAPQLDQNLQGILDSTLTELLSGAGIQRQKYASGGKASRRVDFEAGVGQSPFGGSVSKRLSQSIYNLQKNTGLSDSEFNEIKKTADTYGYNEEEFKEYLAKRIQEKKNKEGLRTNPSALAQQLMPQTRVSTPRQLALAQALKDTSNDIGYRPSTLETIAQARTDVGNATRYAVGGIAKVGKKEDKQYGQISITEDAGMINVGYQKGDNRQGYATGYKMRNNLYYVGLSKATKGYGPRLYDVLMEAVTEKGAMLTSDRSSVSEDAKRVWEYYFKNRGDVKKTPLKPSDWTVNSNLIDPKLYGKKETWPPATDPAWTLQTGYSKSPKLITNTNEVIRKRSGGRLSFETGGTVPALVSNGEAYIPPKIAKRIGYSNLNRMNQADRNGMSKFSSGGISVFKGPGTGTSDSIPANLPVGSFILREKATKALGFNKGGAVPAQRFATGGGVTSMIMEWLSSDMTARTKPKMAPRPDVVNRASVVASNDTTKALDILVKSLNQLGLSAANSADILNKGGQVSYKTIQKALAEDIKRLKISGASIQSIVAAETTLANIRKKSKEEVTKQKNIQGLTSARGNSSTKIVGGQTIGDLQAGSGAGQQAIETQAQMLAAARIRRRGGKVTEKQRSEIMESSYIDSASRITGIKKKEFKAAGISGGDIQKYIAESMKDRKSLAQMDKQLIALKTNELTNSAAYIAASNAEQKRMLTEVQQATKEEISTRRKIINDLAAQNGTKGVGAAGLRDTRNSPILNQIKGFIKSPGKVMGGISAAAGLTAGASDMIAKNIYNMSTTEGQGKAAKTSAAIQSSGTILSTGMAAASQMAAIPVIGPYVAALTAVGTAAAAAADYFYDFTGAQKAATVEFERSVRAKEIGIAMDGLDRAFQNFEKDMGNITLQKALEQAIGNTSSLQIKDNMAERDNAKAEFSLKNRSWSDIFSGNFKGSAQMDALEQGAMDSEMSQKLSPISDKAMALYDKQISSGKSIEDIVNNVRTGNKDAVNAGAAVAFNANPKLWSELEQKVKASGDASEANVLKIKRGIVARELLTNAELQAAVKRSKLERDMEASNRAGRRLAETFDHISETIDQSIQRMQRESEIRQAQANDRVEARRGNAGFDERAVNNRNVGVLTNPKAYQNDPRRIEEAIRAGSSGMSPELAQKMAGGARLEATLPNVMRNAISTELKSNASLGLDEAADAARRKGTEAIRNSGLSEADQKVAIDKLNARIEDEKKKVQDNEKGTPAEQVDSFTDSISDLGPEIANIFGNAGKKLDDIIQARQGIYDTFAKNLQAASEAAKKAREFFSKARDIRYDAGMDLREAQTGVGESFSEAKAKSDSSIARLTGGVTDPQAIGRNIDALMARRDQQMKDRDAALSNPNLTQDQQKDAATKFAKDIQATNNALNDNREALDKLANSAEVAQKALDEVKNIRGLQQDRENFVNQLLTNTPEEADKLNQTFIRLQRNLSGGLNNASNQRDARNAFNDTLRRTGNLREATRAGNTVLADQRKQTLQLMQDPGFRGMMTLNMKNQGMNDQQIDKRFRDQEGMLMQQMAIESGLINNPMVRQALAAKQDPNADPAMKRAADQFLQATGLQAKASEEQGRLELANVQNLLVTATDELRMSIDTLTTTINGSLGKDGERVPGVAGPVVPVPAGARGVARPPRPMATGGKVKTQYASTGQLIDFSPKGTDTVPAMLTPGEFVVNARSTAKHLPLLKAINSGAGVDATSNMSKGGVVYLDNGGLIDEFRKIDANKSNFLEVGEIDLKMIQLLDRDKDNKVSFGEYSSRVKSDGSSGSSRSGSGSSVKSGFKAQDMSFEQYYNNRAQKYAKRYQGTGDEVPRDTDKFANGGMVTPYYLAEGTNRPLSRPVMVALPPKKDPIETARAARKQGVPTKRRPSLVPGDPRAKDAEPSFFRLDLNEDGILDRKEGYPYQDLDKDKDGNITQEEWKNNVLARAKVRKLENTIKIIEKEIAEGKPVPVNFEAMKRTLGFAKIDAGMAAAPGDNKAFIARQKRIDDNMNKRLLGGGSINNPDGSYVFNRELNKIYDRRSAFEEERRAQRAKDENATDEEIFDRTVEAYGAGDSNYWRNSMGVTELPNVYDNSRTLDVIRNESDLSSKGDPNGEKTRAYIDGYIQSQGARQQADRVARGIGAEIDSPDIAVTGTQGPVDNLNYLIDQKEKGRVAEKAARDENFKQENKNREGADARQAKLDQRDKELGIDTSGINRDIYESGGGFSNQPGSGRKVTIEEQKQRKREKAIAARFSFTDKTGKYSTTGTIDKVDFEKGTVRIAKIDPKTGEPITRTVPVFADGQTEEEIKASGRDPERFKVGEKEEQVYTTVPLDKLSDQSRDKARSHGLEKEADKAKAGENFSIGEATGKKRTISGKIFRVDEKAGTAVVQRDSGKLVTIPLEKLAPESRNIALDQAKTATTVTDLTQKQMDADVGNIDVTSSLPEPPIPLAEDFTDRANEVRQETMNNAALEQTKMDQLPMMSEPVPTSGTIDPITGKVVGNNVSMDLNPDGTRTPEQLNILSQQATRDADRRNSNARYEELRGRSKAEDAYDRSWLGENWPKEWGGVQKPKRRLTTKELEELGAMESERGVPALSRLGANTRAEQTRRSAGLDEAQIESLSQQKTEQFKAELEKKNDAEGGVAVGLAAQRAVVPLLAGATAIAAAPALVPAGIIGAGLTIAGGVTASLGANKLQDMALEGTDFDKRQRELAEKRPGATAVGSLLPGLLTGNPLTGATTMGRALATRAASGATEAALGAGIRGATSGGDFGTYEDFRNDFLSGVILPTSNFGSKGSRNYSRPEGPAKPTSLKDVAATVRDEQLAIREENVLAGNERIATKRKQDEVRKAAQAEQRIKDEVEAVKESGREKAVFDFMKPLITRPDKSNSPIVKGVADMVLNHHRDLMARVKSKDILEKGRGLNDEQITTQLTDAGIDPERAAAIVRKRTEANNKAQSDLALERGTRRAEAKERLDAEYRKEVEGVTDPKETAKIKARFQEQLNKEASLIDVDINDKTSANKAGITVQELKQQRAAEAQAKDKAESDKLIQEFDSTLGSSKPTTIDNLPMGEPLDLGVDPLAPITSAKDNAATTAASTKPVDAATVAAKNQTVVKAAEQENTSSLQTSAIPQPKPYNPTDYPIMDSIMRGGKNGHYGPMGTTNITGKQNIHGISGWKTRLIPKDDASAAKIKEFLDTHPDIGEYKLALNEGPVPVFSVYFKKGTKDEALSFAQASEKGLKDSLDPRLYQGADTLLEGTNISARFDARDLKYESASSIIDRQLENSPFSRGFLKAEELNLQIPASNTAAGSTASRAMPSITAGTRGVPDTGYVDWLKTKKFLAKDPKKIASLDAEIQRATNVADDWLKENMSDLYSSSAERTTRESTTQTGGVKPQQQAVVETAIRDATSTPTKSGFVRDKSLSTDKVDDLASAGFGVISPDQEVESVIRGARENSLGVLTKPAALLQPETYQKYADQLLELEKSGKIKITKGASFGTSGQPSIFVGKPENVDTLAKAFESETARTREMGVPASDEFHETVGKALGYSKDSRELFRLRKDWDKAGLDIDTIQDRLQTSRGAAARYMVSEINKAKEQASVEQGVKESTNPPIKPPIDGDEFELGNLGDETPEEKARLDALYPPGSEGFLGPIKPDNVLPEARAESQARTVETKPSSFEQNPEDFTKLIDETLSPFPEDFFPDGSSKPNARVEAEIDSNTVNASSPEALKASAEAQQKLAAQKLAAKSPEQISVEKTYGPLYREAKKANDTAEMARIRSEANAEFKKRSQEASTRAEDKKNSFLPVMGKVLKIAAPIGTAIGYGLGSLLTRDKRKEEPQDPASKLKNASSLQEVYDLISANDRGTKGFSAVEIAMKLREIDPKAYDKSGDEYVNLGELAGMPDSAYDAYLDRLKDRAATAKPVNYPDVPSLDKDKNIKPSFGAYIPSLESTMAPQQYGAGVYQGPSSMPTFDLTKTKTDAAAMPEVNVKDNNAAPMPGTKKPVKKALGGLIYASEGMKIPRPNTILSSSQSNSGLYDRYASSVSQPIDIGKSSENSFSRYIKSGGRRMSDNVEVRPKLTTDEVLQYFENKEAKERREGAPPAGGRVQYATGGIVYANNGALINAQPMGTDTVPAMLTPGEFVVKKEQAQKHAPILHAINSGAYSRGGIVNYLANGGVVNPNYLSYGGYPDMGDLQNRRNPLKEMSQRVAEYNASMAPQPVPMPAPAPVQAPSPAPAGGVSSNVGIDVANLQSIVTNLQKTVNDFGASIPSLSQVAESMNTGFSSFVTGGSQIGQMLNSATAGLQQVNLPDRIRLEGSVSNNVNINGAEAAARVMDTMGGAIQQGANEQIGRFAGAINRGIGNLGEGALGPDTGQIMGQIGGSNYV